MKIVNPADPPTKELWVGVVNSTAGLGYWAFAGVVAGGAAGRVSFKVPHDFNTLLSAEMLVFPIDTHAAADWDIITQYCAVGQVFNANTEQDVASTYNVTQNILFSVDISGELTGIAADDYVGAGLLNNNAAHRFYLIGLRFRYN